MEGEKKDDQPLDENRYKKENGEFTSDAIKLYMFEKKIGKAHQFKAKEHEETPNEENGKMS